MEHDLAPVPYSRFFNSTSYYLFLCYNKIEIFNDMQPLTPRFVFHCRESVTRAITSGRVEEQHVTAAKFNYESNQVFTSSSVYRPRLFLVFEPSSMFRISHDIAPGESVKDDKRSIRTSMFLNQNRPSFRSFAIFRLP